MKGSNSEIIEYLQQEGTIDEFTENILELDKEAEDKKGEYPKLRDEIEKYSSGLTQVSIHTQDEIRFRLDHTKIKENISVNGGKLISASETGGYVLVIPRVGEFNVELGEIIDGERIPLHNDSFCMT